MNAQAIETNTPEIASQETHSHVERICWPEAADAPETRQAGTAIRLWLTMAAVPAILALGLTAVL